MRNLFILALIFITTLCISQNEKKLQKESVNKDKYGHFISKEVKEGDKTVLKDRDGHSLGKYDQKTNITSTMDGHKIGTGNQLNSMKIKK